MELNCLRTPITASNVVGESEESSLKSSRSAHELVKKVKELMHEGNVTKIIVRDEQGRVLLEVPVTAGLVGAVLAPWLAAVGAIAALVTRCNISVERREDHQP